MSRVVEINQIEELSSYRLVWNSLFPRTRNATFFQTIDWLETYWKHYGEDQKLRVLIVYCDENTPVGILPLCVRKDKYKLGTLRVLTYPLHNWGTFFGPIGPNPTATLLTGLQHIQQTERNWDVCDLRWIATDQTDFGRTSRAMNQVGMKPKKKIWATTAVIDERCGWEDYFASRTSKWRNNYRRNEKRLAKQGEVEFIRYRPQGGFEDAQDVRMDLYDDCLEVAGNSWQSTSKDGTTLTHSSTNEFLIDAHQLAVKLGMLDLSLLKVSGKPAAFAYNYHCNGNVFGLRTGFDSDFMSCGIGNVLQVRTIQASFESGDVRFDLGPGSLEYKRHLSTHLESSYSYTYYSSNVMRAQAIRFAHWLKDSWKGRKKTAPKISELSLSN